MKADLEKHYGYVFEDSLLSEIEKVGRLMEVKQGDILIDLNQEIRFMPLLFEGAIKILREDKDGDELLLYFIEKGDSCAMTFSCCMGSGTSEIRAVAEVDTRLVMIPVAYMELWMEKYQSWRRFVLDSYHGRMTELLETVDTLAFMKMDERLLKYLQDRAMVTHDDVIHATHQEVALDLHTSRVVVSRLLKRLEREGKIAMERHAIKLLQL
ncbi:Crp/Fnr family transcriptional regulator [Poritiphilus flavus]|uniref:Helix-turn-helix domain-containing protein n=1 Tax=Poritiphilus flavus TaxID=2697053 RepID=A0A6L9EHS7_9FLAO|nr:Crp/Fnr family transcriptional regulator [Poritiphilus flavus]NAS14281.1 helix-turn-helix domain-containing protein [Poritiphilus flavus]